MSFEINYELLPTPPHSQPGWVAWRELSPWVQTRIQPPDFLLGDCPAGLLAAYHDQVGEADTGIFVLAGAGVTSAGMIVYGDSLVAANQLGHSVAYCRGELATGRIRAPGHYRRRRLDSAVLLLGGGHHVYGHWLVDIMPKLYALRLAGYALADLRILVPADMHRYGRTWLELAGIRPDQLEIYDQAGEIVEAESLIVPVLLRSGSRASRLFAPAVSFLIEQIEARAPQAAPGEAEAVFVSRAKAGRDGRAMRNRAEIEALAEDSGYKLVYPERLGIAEQVGLFRGARRIVGEYGSGLHNTIFSAPGSITCCLRGAALHPGFLQSGLAQALGQRCGYVVGAAPLDAIEFQFDIDPDMARRALRLMSLPDA